MNKNSKIFIAGHNGMVGSAIYRLLAKNHYNAIIVKNRQELDLMDQSQVDDFFNNNKPEYVFLCAAKVGGIQANISHPATFLLDNLVIQNNIIQSSLKYGVKKLLFLGSSCVYPKECKQPMKEEYLLSGKLEPTNEGYAIAKIAGLKLIEGLRKEFGFNGISLMPCNLYGPNDSFDLAHSHVLSALVKRFVDAYDENLSNITLWGTGIARREFMHVDDLAEASLFMMLNYNEDEFINIGCGTDVSIKELAELVSNKVGYKGLINWDVTKPDGMLKKCMDVSKMANLGFNPKISLEKGVTQMIDLYNKTK
ncbi:GDP-L-fucose synthase family protein [Aquirufa sp. A-Brett2-W8]